MRTINNTYYNFTFTRDKYILANRMLTDLTYSLYYVETGKVDRLVESKTISGTLDPIEKVFQLHVKKDGRYRLEVAEALAPDKFVYFTHSLDTRDLIVRKLIKVICKDCKCKDCNDCGDKKCLANQSLFNLIHHYLYVNKDFSTTGYPSVNNKTYDWYKKIFNTEYDNLNSKLYEQCASSAILGLDDIDQDLLSYYFAIYYVGWYLEAKLEIDNLDIESLEHLDKVYEYKKLSECIKKLGINIENIIEDFNNLPSNVHYWQLGMSEDFNDLQNLFNGTFLYSKPFETLEIFEEGFNVPQNSIGKICFGITNVDNQSFILEDSLGNDVTNNFETFYDNSLRCIVFCSIPSYSVGSLFFKFKTL